MKEIYRTVNQQEVDRIIAVGKQFGLQVQANFNVTSWVLSVGSYVHQSTIDNILRTAKQ